MVTAQYAQFTVLTPFWVLMKIICRSLNCKEPTYQVLGQNFYEEGIYF